MSDAQRSRGLTFDDCDHRDYDDHDADHYDYDLDYDDHDYDADHDDNDLCHRLITSVRIASPVLPTIPTIPVKRTNLKREQKELTSEENQINDLFEPATPGMPVHWSTDVHCSKGMLQMAIGPTTSLERSKWV